MRGRGKLWFLLLIYIEPSYQGVSLGGGTIEEVCRKVDGQMMGILRPKVYFQREEPNLPGALITEGY